MWSNILPPEVLASLNCLVALISFRALVHFFNFIAVTTSTLLKSRANGQMVLEHIESRAVRNGTPQAVGGTKT